MAKRYIACPCGQEGITESYTRGHITTMVLDDCPKCGMTAKQIQDYYDKPKVDEEKRKKRMEQLRALHKEMGLPSEIKNDPKQGCHPSERFQERRKYGEG